MQRICIALATLAAPMLVSCIDAIDDGGTGSDSGGSGSGSSSVSGTDSESALDLQLMGLAATYKTSFTQINTTTDKSSLGDFDINLYVYGDVSDYTRIHPETASTSPVISIGTIIVREVLDSTGTNIAKLTVMAKGPEGYDASLGDWWFAEAQADGQPFVDGGVIRVGKLDDCHSCHIPRESEDYMFGVPQADQAHKE